MAGSPAILIERLSRLLQNDAYTHGLNPTQWEALRYLARANRFSRSPGALTAYLGVTKGTVSQTLQALERKDLIQKRASDTDRRSVKLDLTPAGAALLKEDPLKTLETAMEAMPPHSRDGLGAWLESLLKALITRRGGRAFGACKTCQYFQPRHDQGTPHFCSLLTEPLSAPDSEKICVEQEAA